MNFWYLSRSKEDADAFEKWYESLGVGYHDIYDWDMDSPELREVRKRVEESWPLMFDLEAPRDENWHFPYIKRSFQATFWGTADGDVVSQERFREWESGEGCVQAYALCYIHQGKQSVGCMIIRFA